MSLYLNFTKAYPTLRDVEVELDPTVGEMLPALQVGSYNFLDQKWPVGVQDQLFTGVQGVFAGTSTIDDMLREMDEMFAEGSGR